MRILIVVSSLNTGGAQRVAANLSIGLEGSCEVDFLLNEASSISYAYRGNIIDLGFGEESNRLKLGYQLRVFFRRVKALRRLKRTNKYDAVCSFLDSANIANILTGSSRCKTIISVHGILSGYNSIKEYRFIVIPLVRILYRHASTIVAVSRSVRDDLVDNLGLRADNIVTIYNGFVFNDILKRAQSELTDTEAGLFDKHTVITAMGRLEEAKGFEHLIRIMPIVRNSIPDCRLIILGEGDNKPTLLKMIEELDLRDCVVPVGFKDNPFNVIAASDVFVMPSLDEALPSVIIEAMILSVPCISTDLPGALEILAPNMAQGETYDSLIEGEYGIITPVFKEKCITAKEEVTQEESVMAQAIVYMLKNSEVYRRYCHLPREATDRFEAKRMASEWLKQV